MRLQRVLPALVSMLRPLLRPDIEVELHVPADVAPTSIVANARDAMPRGGVLRTRHPAVRIVHASGYSVAADRARLEGLRVLQKPVSMANLVRAVEEA